MSAPKEVIQHHNFQLALTKAHNAAATACPGQCILLVGPTGAGKSTLLSVLLDMLVGTPNTWPEGEQHYINLECDREAPGAITRNIAVDLNRALGNPFVQLRVPGAGQKNPFGPVRLTINEHDLRETFRLLAAVKRTRFVGIDALENIVPQQLISAEARFDSIKSLVRSHNKHAKAHEMTLILAGHYNLLKFWDVNAQLARRITEVVVAPYRETAPDIARFERILEDMTPRYGPLKGDRSLRDWNDVLFRLSSGCIGLLSKLLDDAVVCMRCRGGKSLALEDVIDAAPPKRKHDAVHRDISDFWPYLETSATREMVAPALARERGGADTAKPKAPAKTRRGKPGRRKVGPRDPAGFVS